ncbi:glycosyltransferase family 2 protein [Aerophototrophica crusticola]|uniref:Glycosyltransferase family 2 protein n=1 Tax=Aerophototrophica crusticola TaxID=1709002 RepID=A0A858R819_9PROT|nr:glycosyltransferase family 2 protein [Rhodospirillaceae bacterium B3]
MSSPLVSVIVPAYNAAPTLRETLESALAQTYGNLEIIVVDDGSRDATPDIVRELAARDPRVRLIQQPNGGCPIARNTALNAARGEYVASLDGDDLWQRDKIELQVRSLEEAGPSAALCYCWSWAIDKESRVIPNGIIHAFTFADNPFPPLVMYGFIGNGSTMLMRRSAMLAVGGYDTSLPHYDEGMMALRLAERWRFTVVPRFLVGYRILPTSMSHRTHETEQFHRDLLDRLHGEHPELPAWLFRLTKAKFELYAAKRDLKVGRHGKGIRRLLKAISMDPLLPLTLRPKGIVAQLVRVSGKEMAGTVPPLPFLEAGPTLDKAGPPALPGLEMRRRARVAVLAARQPDGPLRPAGQGA